MEELQSKLAALKSQGVVARMRGGSLVVSGIPSWSTYIYIESIIDDLLLIGIAKQVFGTPGKKIIPGEGRETSCMFCGNYDQFRCVYHKGICGIPAAILITGCDNWAEGEVYF